MLIALLLALTLDDPTKPATTPTVAAQTTTPSQAPSAAQSQTPPGLVIRIPMFEPVAAESQPPQGLAPKIPANEAAKEMRFVWREHPSIRGGQNFRLDFAAKFQYDGADPGDDPFEFQTWEVHRMRVGIEGELFRHIQYQVERELSERELNEPLITSTKTPWKDVFVEANYTSMAQVRGGKFKIPYGLDQTSSEAELDFVYRSLGGRYLSPGRDRGGMVHGRFFDRGLNYWAGYFLHDGENSKSAKNIGGDIVRNGADETWAARVVVTPFWGFKAGGLPAAALGFSYTNSKLENTAVIPNGLRGRTVVSEFTFFDSMFVNGTRTRYGGDFDWIGGPFGARAEFMYDADSRVDQGIFDEDLTEVRGRAWYAYGTAVLTGEPKTRPVLPRNPVGRGAGLGALEFALRFDRLWFDSEQGEDPPFRNSRARTVFPSGDRVWTIGLNWYLNPWAKIQVNAIREHIQDAERSPILGGAPWWSKVVRFQLAL